MAGEGRTIYYHFTHHARLMGEPAYLDWPLDVKGAYAYLSNLAGLTNNRGSLRIGGHDRLVYEQVIAVLRKVPRTSALRARQVVDRLLFDGYLTAVRGGQEIKPQAPLPADHYKGATLFLTFWVEDQTGPLSNAAARQRVSRSARRFGEFGPDSANSGVTGHTEIRPYTLDMNISPNPNPPGGGLPAVSPPPPRVSGQGSGKGRDLGSGRDQSPKEDGDWVTERENLELDLERETDGAEAESAEGLGLGPEGGGGETAGTDADVYADDPVTAYCKAVGKFTQLDRNTAAKMLRDLAVARGGNVAAEQIFRAALRELTLLKTEGRIPRVGRDQAPLELWRYFRGIYNRHMEGRP
jgi:hypothetical protein